jgi:hypothetical protein
MIGVTNRLAHSLAPFFFFFFILFAIPFHTSTALCAPIFRLHVRVTASTKK